MSLPIICAADDVLEDELSDRLVTHNKEASEAILRRFEPAKLRDSPVDAPAARLMCGTGSPST
jgi:hypothetical protein